jgi:CheY-like chemotaxis protein
VTLPLRQSPTELEVAAPAGRDASQAPVAPGPLRILIAEDNEANVQVYAGYLGPRGHQLIFARNGQEAIDQALAERPDLILMDVHMPVLDGLSAIKRLRADPRMVDLPIIAITALAMPEDRRKCLAAGASDYLSKPINLRELTRTIAKLVRPAAPAAVETVVL